MQIEETTLEEALKNFTPPTQVVVENDEFVEKQLPYALFWRRSRLYKNKQNKWIDRLTAISLIGHNGTPAGIRYYSRKKGWKLLKYWAPDSAKFVEAKKEMDLILGYGNERVQELEAETSAMAKKIAELEAKEKAKAKA